MKILSIVCKSQETEEFCVEKTTLETASHQRDASGKVCWLLWGARSAGS